MSELTYPAAICGREGAYGVVFPDFAGCISAGDTLAEAADMAREALQLHVDCMVEDGETLPPASHPTLGEIAVAFDDPADPAEESWVKVIDVTIDAPLRLATIPLRVKADLVQRIADLAESTARKIDSRRFIEEAVEHEIERYRKSAA